LTSLFLVSASYGFFRGFLEMQHQMYEYRVQKIKNMICIGTAIITVIIKLNATELTKPMINPKNLSRNVTMIVTIIGVLLSRPIPLNIFWKAFMKNQNKITKIMKG